MLHFHTMFSAESSCCHAVLSEGIVYLYRLQHLCVYIHAYFYIYTHGRAVLSSNQSGGKKANFKRYNCSSSDKCPLAIRCLRPLVLHGYHLLRISAGRTCLNMISFHHVFAERQTQMPLLPSCFTRINPGLPGCSKGSVQQSIQIRHSNKISGPTASDK